LEMTKQNQDFKDCWEELNTPFPQDNESSWDAIQKKIEEKETPVYSIWDYPRKRPLLKWAASFVLIFALAILVFLDSGSSMQSSLIETDFQLPDESQIFLFKNSSIDFKENNKGRYAKLTGGGIFNVVKGKTFQVETAFGSVEVLGTQFSVETGNSSILVKCSEGSVKLSRKGKSEELIAGEGIFAEGQEFRKFLIGKDEIEKRKKGQFQFIDVPLNEVLFQIESAYGVEIKNEKNFSNLRYSGQFNSNDLSQALDLVLQPMVISYQIIGEEIELYP